MRIQILGGGPAGLYAGILLKKRDPSASIVLTERNAPDDTFGWGVVFSDETLSNLAHADAETFEAIAAGFARWDSIDIRHRGQVIRSSGHGFCGIARKHLLEILQRRARELGVEMCFKTEVSDVDALRRDADLLIGADGLRSLVRTRWQDTFRPSFDVRKSRYMWLGTTQRFPAFTFSFRENEHGLFQIHAYQFDETHGTVIVECDDASWRAAGLDRASEAESIAYCAKVFAPDLDGHPLLGNRSSWIQFTTVKNERWSHENAVILGDAAHTAHFSIGSGTKLAMEDAISLVGAIDKHPHDLRVALESYEAERKPQVGRTQTAAQQSLEWFEDSKRYVGQAPLTFAMSLLTRSRRVTHANLRMRDAGFVERVDRDFAERARVNVGSTPPPPMFTPFAVRGTTFENRVVVSPMCMYSAVDGVPNDFHLVHLGSRAMGGAGLVFTEMTNVAADARISEGCTGIWGDAHVEAWKRIVDFVHAHSRAKLGLQLGHAGRKGSTKKLWEGMDEPLASGGWQVIGPSAIAYDPKKGMQVPREMTRADMLRVIDEHVRGAENADRAGFDVLELHMAHGYLLSSFLTPVSNRRTDAYGGSREARMRYPLEVLDAVRAAWPADKPLSVRVSATDWVEDGLSGDDAVVIARALKEHGADLVDVSTGQTTPDAKPVFGRCYQTPFSDRIRNEVGIPTISVGNIPDADQVNSILAAGRADLVALARPHLADPHFTLRAAIAQGWDEVVWPPQYFLAKPIRPKA